MSEGKSGWATSAQAWREKAEKDLRGRELGSLSTRTLDGFELDVLYRPDTHAFAEPGLPGQAPFVRGRTALGAGPTGWEIRTSPDAVHPQDVNARLRSDYARGAKGAWLHLDSALARGEATGAAPDGLRVSRSECFDQLLAGVDMPVWIEAGAVGSALVERSGGRVHAVVDPFSLLVRNGRCTRPLARVFDEAASELSNPQFALGVSTRALHDAGASDAQELALAWSTLVEWMRELESRGISPGRVAANTVVHAPVGCELFAGVAKLRALRLGWGRVCEAAEAGESSPWIHASSSWREQSVRAPWVNLLRGTLSTFAAVSGGADSVSLTSFDALANAHASSELGARLATNTQVLAAEEAHLGRVVDPGGGSWYLESRTRELARAAWTIFQRLEAAGGLLASLRSGELAKAVEAKAAERLLAVRRGKHPLTGISRFAKVHERGAPTPASTRSAPDLPSLVEAQEGGVAVRAMPRQRLAAPFEALRDRAELLDEPPRVALLGLGSLAEHQPRAEFGAAFFSAGGVEAASVEADGTVASLASGFQSSGLKVALVVGTDDAYASQLPKLVKRLASGGATRVFVAGKAPEEIDLPDSVPVRWIARGTDMVTVIDKLLTHLHAEQVQGGAP